MGSALKAGLSYFAMVFAAGFVLGALREFVLVPSIGEFAAVALELPVILIISWLGCRKLVAWFSVPATASQRLAMGALAFGLLVLAESSLSVFVFNRTAAGYISLLQTPSGLLGLAGQTVFAFFPFVQLKK